MSPSKIPPPNPFPLVAEEQEWVQSLVEKVRALHFGSVHVKVHESQVVWIETTEQTRFDLSPKLKR